MNSLKYQLILASASPRRKMLLINSGFKFQVLPSKVSEIPNKNLNINEQILEIASQKAEAVYEGLKNGSLKGASPSTRPFLVLAADTEVVIENKTLGKPVDEKDAFRMLKLLSGRGHLVKTAIVFIESERRERVSHIETTEVIFRVLSDQEINNYIKTGDPMDKAGAYGLQNVGKHFVEKFIGSYDNIIGLSVDVVQKMLREKNWVVE